MTMVRRLMLSMDGLAELLKLPEGVEIVAAQQNLLNRQIDFYVADPDSKFLPDDGTDLILNTKTRKWKTVSNKGTTRGAKTLKALRRPRKASA